MKHAITISKGDGIGPEIMEATLLILKAAGANLDIHEVEVGEKVYRKGCLSGIEPQTWDTIKGTKAFLKAPITTPQGGGFKSLNVTIRTTLGLYANVRPCVSYFPYIDTQHPTMDVTIIRENEEDLYSGIEYQQSPHVCVSHKVISKEGCLKIIRYAFEYARKHQRKKVSTFTKDNIMKFSDGLFHRVFDEVASSYPDLITEHLIVDIGSAKLATVPQNFDVIVLPNLYGDILSDVAAEMTGSVGLAPSANIGAKQAMFEAIHGSAPKKAMQNSANPSGLFLASVMMMAYLNEPAIAQCMHEAWLKTIEDGLHTPDIFHLKTSQKQLGTQEFAKAVAANLGKKPLHLSCPNYQQTEALSSVSNNAKPTEKIIVNRKLVGVDVFIYLEASLQDFLSTIHLLSSLPLKLDMVSNRGVKVWPEGHLETICLEQWRLRFMNDQETILSSSTIVSLLEALIQAGYDIIKTEHLYTFDGKKGYSSAEGS